MFCVYLGTRFSEHYQTQKKGTQGEQYVLEKKENNQNCVHATKQGNEADFLLHHVLFSDTFSLSVFKNAKLILNIGAFKVQGT